ncbi:VWA domain-containing protein, partial [Candidatus Poribacteria bacterium]|nr:VWA domain-containing protein [Candidatus Poribacteria bacterium]
MQFARPGAALLLLLLPLLVLLHARGGRRRDRVVPSVSLWDDVPVDARGNPKRPRVPLNWEFVLQAAVVVTGALALMGPMPSGPTQGSRRVVLVIDTSVSMAATDVRPSRLGAAQAAALGLLAQCPRGARAAVILADSRPKLALGFTADLEAVGAVVSAAAATDAAADVPSAVALARSLVGGADVDIHVFTHFSINDAARGPGPSPIWHVFGSGGDNVSLRDLRVVSDTAGGAPDGYVALLRVTNHGRRQARVSTVLTPSTGPPVARTTAIEAGATVDMEFTGATRRDEDVAFSAHAQHADALDRDNHAYAVLRVARSLSVVVVGR